MPTIVMYIVLPVVGIVLGWIIRWIYARFQLTASEQKAERVKREAILDAEAQKKEILLNAKDEIIRERNQQERENRERRAEVQRFEARVNKKEELLEQRAAEFEKSEKELAEKQVAIGKKEEELSKQEELYRAELEKISGLSAQEAKELIIKNLENDARHDAQALINKIEQDAQLSAEKKARDILITTIQRIAPETTSDITVTTVSLPSDEMKGRIIGREGRNIRTLETLTGVDIIIDDTPEAVVISCFDPVRKEIAKESSAAKGESVSDTIRVISCYADICAMRHPKEGAPMVASEKSTIPVINAGDGGHQHPTQTLTDLLTIRSLKGRLDNFTIGLCGDLKFGRTVHSLINALVRYEGIKFIFISPEELRVPDYITDMLREKNIPYEEVIRLEQVMPDLDFLYMTRVQKERFFNEEDYIRLKDFYILDTAKMDLAKKDMLVLHPLPRVNEISVEVDSDPRAGYFKQAQYGVYVRMALILTLLELV